jgi:hypothetical protein
MIRPYWKSSSLSLSFMHLVDSVEATGHYGLIKATGLVSIPTYLDGTVPL